MLSYYWSVCGVSLISLVGMRVWPFLIGWHVVGVCRKGVVDGEEEEAFIPRPETNTLYYR